MKFYKNLSRSLFIPYFPLPFTTTPIVTFIFHSELSEGGLYASVDKRKTEKGRRGKEVMRGEVERVEACGDKEDR